MTIHDTYEYGSLYVDADLTISNLEDSDLLEGVRGEVVEALRESGATFEFDDDWSYGSMYWVDGQETPLVLIGWFGGYPGEALDEANLRAAKEWAADRDYIYSFSSWFGGCESVRLYLNFDDCTLEEAEEAIELAEEYMDYPVLDEDLYSQIEWERWEDMIEDLIVQAEADEDFTEDQKDQIRDLASEFQGYWEEGYFGTEEWNEIIEKVRTGDVQLHQETTLDFHAQECNCSNPHCQV